MFNSDFFAFGKGMVKKVFIAAMFGFIAVILGASVGISNSLESTKGIYAYAQEEDDIVQQLAPGLENDVSIRPDSGSQNTNTNTVTTSPRPGTGDTSGNSTNDSLDDGSEGSQQIDINEEQEDHIVDWYQNRDRPSPLTENRTGAYENSPAFYRDNLMGSDKTETSYSALSNSANFLAFSRWWDSFAFPDPMSFYGISQSLSAFSIVLGKLAFGISCLIFYGLGTALIFSLGVDLLGSASLKADEVFAKIMGYIFSSGGESGERESLMKILTFVLLGIVILFMFRIVKMKQSGTKGILKPFMLFVGGIFVLSVIGSQSAKNHPVSGNNNNLSAIGESQLNNSSTKNLVSDPSAWSFGSVGWATALINTGAKEIMGIVSAVTNVVMGAISAGVSTGVDRPAPTECELYVKGLHAAYQSTPGAQALDVGNLMISFDNMVVDTTVSMYAVGAFGNSEGAGGAWCRTLESSRGTPPGEQAMISRAAGLYPELVGQGGLGLVSSSNDTRNSERPTNLVVNPFGSLNPGGKGREFNVASGSLVAANGEWASSSGKDNVKAAQLFFGPIYASTAGMYESKFYFAGCMWEQGQPAKLRPEWIGVTKANDGTALTDESCTDQITSGSDSTGGFGWIRSGKDDIASADQQWNYTPFMDDTPEAYNKLLDVKDDDNAVVRLFKGTVNFITPDFIVDGKNKINAISGMNIDSQNQLLSKFNNAESANTGFVSADSYQPIIAGHKLRAGNQPREYLQYVSGAKAGTTMMYGFVSAALSLALLKPMAGVIVGALGAQMLAVISMIVMSLMFIILIIPSAAIRSAFKSGVLTVCSAYAVTISLQILFALIIGISNFLFVLVDINSLTGLFRAFLVAIIYWGTFKATVMIINKFFSIDLNNMKDTAKVMSLAGAPALNKMGADVATPFDILKDKFGNLGDKLKKPKLDKGRKSESENKDAINATLKDSERSKHRAATRAARKKENEAKVSEQMKKAAEESAKKSKKTKKQNRFTKAVDSLNNSRLAKIAKDKKARALAKKLPYVAASTAAANKAFGTFKSAKDLAANTWAKGKKGANNLLKNISPDGLNGSDLGDKKINEAMGVQSDNENTLEHSDFRTKSVDTLSNLLGKTPFRNLMPGVLKKTMENTLGTLPENVDLSSLDIATTEEDLKKVAANANGVLSSSGPVGSFQTGVSSAKAIELISTLIKDNKDFLPPSDFDFSENGDVINSPINLADQVVTALGADYAAYPQSINIKDALASGIDIVPGSDDGRGNGIAMPAYGQTSNNLNQDNSKEAVADWASVQTGMDNITGDFARVISKLSDVSNSAQNHQSQNNLDRSLAGNLANDIYQTVTSSNLFSNGNNSDMSAKVDSLMDSLKNDGYISGNIIKQLDSTIDEIGKLDRNLADQVATLLDNSRNSGMAASALSNDVPDILRKVAENSTQGEAEVGNKLASFIESAGAKKTSSVNVLNSLNKS